MVFRQGGKPAKYEKWWNGKEKIKVVNRYKYLEILLTPRLRFKNHLSLKAKAGLNSKWMHVILDRNVNFTNINKQT